jgi:D-amino peptidase
VEACVEGGADEILVCDGHSNGRNVILDLLHPAAELMWGRQNRRLGQVDGIDESFDGLLMVGLHARAGTLGVLNHTTNSGVIQHVKANGLPLGEIDLNAGIAGEFGVPVAMVSGGATAVAQATERMPWIETATTMEPVGMYSAKVLPPVKAQALIREATMRALGRLSEMKPYRFDAPVELEMKFHDTAMADAASMTPGVERVGPRTCACTCENFLEAFRYHWVMITLATGERWERTA